MKEYPRPHGVNSFFSLEIWPKIHQSWVYQGIMIPSSVEREENEILQMRIKHTSITQGISKDITLRYKESTSLLLIFTRVFKKIRPITKSSRNVLKICKKGIG